MNCADCSKWLLRSETRYENGEIVITWEHKEGRGKCCGPLNGVLTAPTFGCNDYQAGGPFVDVRHKEGEPWHHYVRGPCPDCKKSECGFQFPNCLNQQCPGSERCISRGMVDEGTCGRCVGTGLVRYYDDGFVGENKRCMHPKEKVKRDDVQPVCMNCKQNIDRNWAMCPYCGTRLKEEKQNLGGQQ